MLKVKGHVIRKLSWVLGMSYYVIDGLVGVYVTFVVNKDNLRSLSSFKL